MNTSMTVALVLTAYNSMAGVLRSAADQVNQFKSAVTQAKREVSGGFMSEEWFRGALEGVRQAQQALNQMRTSGTADIAEGMAMIAPVEQVVRKAAELEDVMQEVRANIYEAGMPAGELDRLMGEVQQKALELGAATRYSSAESGSAMLTLIKGGMDLKTVLEGGAEASLMLAQVAKIPPDFSAEAMIKIGNAFNVTGKEMLAVADTLSRIDAASTASVPSLLEGMKYVSGTAAQMGLSVKETAAALAVLTNRGMEGSIAGTSLNQMLLRLTPDAKEAAKALEKVGINFQRDFFDAAGRAKPLLEIIEVLREHLAGLPENVKMDILTDVFRVEGARAAIALMQEGKGSLEEINAAYARAIPLQERVAMMQDTFAAKWENMKGSLENLMSAAGTPFMNEIKGLVDQAMNLLNVLTDWISANPQVASGIAKVLVALGGLKIATGIGRLAISFLGEPLLGAANVALRAARSLKGFYETFRYFREGAGFFRALWGAISFGHPTITRLGLLVGRLGGGLAAAGRQAAQFGLARARAVAQGPGGFISFAGSGIRLAGQFGLSLLRLSGQAMLAAGRMAAAWLIGLGPVGWIILGVTAAIAGAVVAWRTNLFGFRDAMIGAWTRIRSFTAEVWPAIKGAVDAVMNWLRRLPAEALEWGRNLLNSFIRGIKDRVAAIPEALQGAAQKIKDFLGFSSPTREGPGRSADRWAPAFVGMYVQGLLRGRRQITAAAASLAAALALATAQPPSVGPLLPVSYLVRPAVEAPVLPPATEGTYFVRPVLGPSEAAAATLRLAAAGVPAAAGGERTEFHLHIQKIEVLGSGRPDYDARRLAERLGPEIERWLEARAKYRQSRTARGFRG